MRAKSATCSMIMRKQKPSPEASRSREASDKACRQGAAGTPQVQVQVRQIRSRTGEINMFFESIVEAIATDQFGG